MSGEKYVYIGKWKVYYTIIGNGPHVVLFVQGALAHCLREFRFQIENFDKEKFTIVAWDPPGYAKSRPPEREITENVYSENADFAYKFMKALNFDYFSVWGTCSGGTASMILAARYPHVVRALVLTNTRSFMHPNEHTKFDRLRYLDAWAQQSLYTRLEYYGEELLAKFWAAWLSVLKNVAQSENGNFFDEKLEDISCPTLILGGGDDPVLDLGHASYLHKHINGSELYIDPEGRHTFHLQKPEEFSRRVQEFLNEY